MRIQKIRDVKTPERGTSLAAGIDFFIPNDHLPTPLGPGEDLIIRSGVLVDFTDELIPGCGMMLMGANKSSVATSEAGYIRSNYPIPKKGALASSLIVGAKIVDEDYQNELGIHVINVGPAPVCLQPGMKIAQFILVPVKYPTIELVDGPLFTEESERGQRGFGHGTN